MVINNWKVKKTYIYPLFANIFKFENIDRNNIPGLRYCPIFDLIQII